MGERSVQYEFERGDPSGRNRNEILDLLTNPELSSVRKVSCHLGAASAFDALNQHSGVPRTWC